jgi:pyrroline-5-carboxylate reductase
LVSVKTHEKVQSLSDKFLGRKRSLACPLEFVVGNNVEAASSADVVVLACHPRQAIEILEAQGMPEALAGKLLMSMLGGVSVAALEDAIYSGSARVVPERKPCHIIVSIPNVAAARKRSITVIDDKSASIPEHVLELGMDVLHRIGGTVSVNADQMPTYVALCASGTAFFAWFLDVMIEGAVSGGLNRNEAQHVAAMTMSGAVEMVISGETPGEICSKVTTPGGATAAGLATLEKGEARSTIIKAPEATIKRLAK